MDGRRVSTFFGHLQELNAPDTFMHITGPKGVTFPLNCQFITDKRVFQDDNPTGDHPPGFSNCCDEGDVRRWKRLLAAGVFRSSRS